IGWVSTSPGGRAVGVIPNLGRLTMRAGPAEGVPLYAERFEAVSEGRAIGAAEAAGYRFEVSPGVLDRAGYTGRLAVEYTSGSRAEGSAARLITCRLVGSAPGEGELLALDGPMFCAGENAFAGKSEALVPGMEWILEDEDSSNSNVISHTHPHRLRWRQHPHLVTVPMMSVRKDDLVAGLFWHPRARWNDATPRDGLAPGEADSDRPTPVFAAPDRFSGHSSAVMGLSVPSVGTYVQANTAAAGTGWPAAGVAARVLDLTFAFYVESGVDSALAALRSWFDIYGVAPPRPPPQSGPGEASEAAVTAAFRGSGLPDWVLAANREGTWREPTREQWLAELDWSMQGYLKTLWDPELKEWRIHHGGPPIKRREGAYPNFLYDIVTTVKLTRDAALRQALEAQAATVVEAHNGPTPAALDMGFRFGDPLPRLCDLDSQVAGLLRSQDEDGGWRYRTRVEQGGTFKGRDYAGLAYDGFEASGLVARNAWTLLRAYRLTGEEKLLAAGCRALGHMEKFRVPRAAQVWEVIGHAPDILAAADGCEAYIEGYLATGREEYLERARYWAWAGLPFVYQWGVDGFPWMRYGSIPIFGSTWWTCTWFGRPVQWNGMRYANAILQLAEHDGSFPWATVAQGITISGLYQQGFDPDNAENYALWPDVYNAVTGDRVEWNFAPRRIVDLIHLFLGYAPEPRSMRVQAGVDSPPMIVSACARIVEGRYLTRTASLSVVIEDGAPLHGRIVVAGVSEPGRVLAAGRALRRTADSVRDPETWYYDGEHRCVVAFPPPMGKGEVRLEGVTPLPSGLSPVECTRIAFEFDHTTGGWNRAHDITVFAVRGGVLEVDAIGGDPYMTRGNCRLDGNSIRRIRVRLSSSAGSGAQFFWATSESPAMCEAMRVNAPLVGDGEFHEVVFDVGDHPQWRGRTITAIRLDPMSGAEAARIRIDWIRGE
ncbi:MAG: hypothetical protein JXR77_10185, partial [Lentisphaeria bacterium]|nr:hypothetical protein [Lentisphaeria bacterium]